MIRRSVGSGFSRISRKGVWTVLVLALCAGEAYAQTTGSTQPPAGRAGRQGQGPGRQGRPGGPPPDGAITPAALQELLDTMVVVQAERDLGLTDTQFAQFLSRLRALQGARRRGEMQRSRSLMELRRLLQGGESGTVDENQLRERLKSIDDAEAQSLTEIRQARTTLEQILSVRQQARFRLLEEQVERRKLELFARSRLPASPQ